MSKPPDWDEDDAFLCACKGEPYTLDEWKLEAARREAEWREALAGVVYAEESGVCMPSRFGGPLAKWRDAHGTHPREFSEAEAARVREIITKHHQADSGSSASIGDPHAPSVPPEAI
jgi:hypothetical protein